MNKKFMLKYIFSFIAFAFFGNLLAQDTLTKTRKYGLRLGADVYKLTRNFYDKDYKGLEFTGDYRLSKDFYIAGELGNEKRTKNEDNLNYTTSGSYFKVGFDKNAYKNWLNMDNMIYVGMRGGFASYSQELNSYNIYQFGNFYPTNTINTSKKFSGLNASWLEFVTGFKAELFNNIYAGISVRVHYMLSQKEPENFANLYIPGFNKVYENSNFGASINYTISYRIPLYKKQIKTPKNGK
jgi:Domain of unknown function (DUF6048)